MAIDYAALAQESLNADIARIKAAAAQQPDSEFAKANQHVLSAEAAVWPCGGSLSMAGFVWWTLSCECAFTTLTDAFLFEAKGGPDFSVGAAESEILGAFVVDPKKITSGKCHFVLGVGAIAEGGATFSLWSHRHGVLGTLAGPSEGLVAGGLKGVGEIYIK